MDNKLPNIQWEDEQLNNLIDQLLKRVSKQVKENIWYKYSICFKKEKKGNILIRTPQANELN